MPIDDRIFIMVREETGFRTLTSSDFIRPSFRFWIEIFWEKRGVCRIQAGTFPAFQQNVDGGPVRKYTIILIAYTEINLITH